MCLSLGDNFRLRHNTNPFQVPGCAIHNLYSISECHDIAGIDLTQVNMILLFFFITLKPRVE